jgi:hypothetical protein
VRPADRRRAQLATLADIAAQASVLQPATDAAVSACGCVGIVPDGVALELGRLSRGYSKLYQSARHLAVEPELTRTRDELTRVLSYHLHMLRDAGDLAFSGRRDARSEPFRRELAEGLGTYATQLLVIAGRLRAHVLSGDTDFDDTDFDDDEPGQGSRPGTASSMGTGTSTPGAIRERLAPGEFELDDIELSADVDPGQPPV